MNTQHIDKNSIKHFLVSFVLALFSTEFSLGCGVGKEMGDYFSYGHICHWDLTFDALGATFGTLSRILLMKLILGNWQYMWY